MGKGLVKTNAKTFDGKPMIEYAKKCPVPGKASDKNSKRGERQHLILMLIIDQLVRAPEYILPLHAELLTLDPSAEYGGAADDEWDGSYRTVDQLPRGWKIGFILQEAKRLRLAVVTKELLSRVEQEDSDNIPNLFSYITQLPGGLALPKQCQDQTVCSKTCSKRASNVGDRLKFFAERNGFFQNGSLNWRDAGCFQVEFGDGKVVKVIHMSGATVAPADHVLVTNRFHLKNNWLDHKAEMSLKPSTFHQASFFPEETGFLAEMYEVKKKWVGMSTLAKAAAEQLETIEKSRREDTVVQETEVVGDAKGKRAKEQLDRAKVVLAQKKAQRAEKKVVKFNG